MRGTTYTGVSESMGQKGVLYQRNGSQRRERGTPKRSLLLVEGPVSEFGMTSPTFVKVPWSDVGVLFSVNAGSRP